jgi:integrase
MNVREFTDKLRASNSTKKRYAGSISRFLGWAGKREINDELAQEYIDYLDSEGRKPNTLAIVANALRAYWKVQKKDLTLSAPAPQMQEPKYHTIKEILRMLDEAKTPFEKVIVTLLFDTGARIMEIMNLEIAGIDWKNRYVHVTLKGGLEADYMLTDIGINALQEWLEVRKSSSTRVFMDYNYFYAYTVLKTLAKKAGIADFTPHHLRHSFAFFCLSNGATLSEVQQFMKHRSISTTATFYGRSRLEHLRPKRPLWGKEKSNGSAPNIGQRKGPRKA